MADGGSSAPGWGRNMGVVFVLGHTVLVVHRQRHHVRRVVLYSVSGGCRDEAAERRARHRLVIERDLDLVVSRLARPKGHAEPGATEGLDLGGHVDPGWGGDEDLEVAFPCFPRVHC